MAKELQVTDAHRKHEQSLIPGGVTIRVVKSGKTFIYDKIKNVKSYTDRVKTDAKVTEIWVDDKLFWKRP